MSKRNNSSRKESKNDNRYKRNDTQNKNNSNKLKSNYNDNHKPPKYCYECGELIDGGGGLGCFCSGGWSNFFNTYRTVWTILSVVFSA